MANKGKGRVPWHIDGPTPELNSIAVIIDWLMTNGNYSHWRGGDKQNGMTKVVCHGILMESGHCQ